MRRRKFITYLGLLAAAGQSLPLIRVSHSEPVRKRPVIAWVAAVMNSGMPDLVRENTIRSFLRGMSDLGYVQGRDYDFLVLNKIFPDPVPVLEEVATRIRPDVIVASATWEAVAIRKATSSIPIVCPAMADGVHLGLIVSEAHPGGNVTGIEPYLGGLPTKQIELVREIVPHAKRVGLLVDMADPKGPPQLGDLMRASQAFGLEVATANASVSDEILGALDNLSANKVDAVVVLMTNLLLQTSDKLAEMALERRLPTICGYREHVLVGSLISYGVDLRWIYHRAAYFVDRILKGAKPADLPVEFPAGLLLAVNLRTAKALGVTLPPSLLARADEVIE